MTVISVGNFREFLAPGAHNPVNVDGTITELVRNRMEVNPTRYVFDEAQVELDRFYLWINFLIELKDNYLPFLYVIKGEIFPCELECLFLHMMLFLYWSSKKK